MECSSILVAPSGRRLDHFDQSLIVGLADAGVVQYSAEPFILKSGLRSHVYVFGRNEVTDRPNLEWAVGAHLGAAMLEYVGNHKRHCLIGVPTAGTALAQAASMVSHARFHESKPAPVFSHRILRQQKKEHGLHHAWVDGPVEDDVRYWLVDNVVTSGTSFDEAAQHLAEDGYPVRSMPHLVFIDHQKGGVERLRTITDAPVVVVFYLLDIAFVLSSRGIWPDEAFEKVEAEIKAHQLR